MQAVDRAHTAPWITLGDPDALSVTLSARGASIVSVRTPDRHGHVDDIVLGLDDDAAYARHRSLFLGSTVGRVANRIGTASFEIDGVRHVVTANEGANCLHGGGLEAFDAVVWSLGEVTSTSVVFHHRSPDGAEGFPGIVEATTTYRLDDSSLLIEWAATVDRATPLNLTNHVYWNLSGVSGESVLQHDLQVHSLALVATDIEQIPTGELTAVEGTPYDWTTRRRLASSIDLEHGPLHDGLDHHYVFADQRSPDDEVVSIWHEGSGRQVALSTNHDGAQIYTSNSIPTTTGRSGRTFGRHSAICVEPQSAPDAIHHPHLGNVIVQPGEAYHRWARFMFRFS